MPKEHMIIAWGHTRVPSQGSPFGGWLFDKRYYEKCLCGFKATSKSKELVKEATLIHLGAVSGATA